MTEKRDSYIPRYHEQLEREDLRELVEQIGNFFDRFGFRRSIGRIWGTLYFAPRPLTQSELIELLGLSAGLVSTALRELAHYGAIRLVTVSGSRASHYEAESRLLRIVAAILSKRELDAVRRLREVVMRVREEGALDGPAEDFERRLRAIEDATVLYETLANLVRKIATLSTEAIARTIELLRATRLLEVLLGAQGSEKREDEA